MIINHEMALDGLKLYYIKRFVVQKASYLSMKKKRIDQKSYFRVVFEE